MTTSSLETLNNNAVAALQQDNAKFALNALTVVLKYLQTGVFSSLPRQQQQQEELVCGEENQEDHEEGEVNARDAGAELPSRLQEREGSTQFLASQEEGEQKERHGGDSHEGENRLHQQGSSRQRGNHQNNNQGRLMMTSNGTEVAAYHRVRIRHLFEEEEDRQVAFLYGRGVLLDSSGLMQSLRAAFSPVPHRDFFDEALRIVQTSTVLYNLALAHHKYSMSVGFNNNTRGASLIGKALLFYSMSLELVRTMVASEIFPFFQDPRIVVGILNNIGHILLCGMGNVETSVTYFQLCISNITTNPSTTRTREHNYIIPSHWFDPVDLAGLVFNAAILSPSRSSATDFIKVTADAA